MTAPEQKDADFEAWWDESTLGCGKRKGDKNIYLTCWRSAQEALLKKLPTREEWDATWLELAEEPKGWSDAGIRYWHSALARIRDRLLGAGEKRG